MCRSCLRFRVAYYYVFQGMTATRWRLGKKKWLKFFLVMGVAFLICNPTIVLPDTWRTIAKFAGSRMMGHDSYEFMGLLYPHRAFDWLRGEPWYFYFVLLGAKLPIAALIAFAGGVVLLFRRKTGDGRYFLLFWLFFWGLDVHVHRRKIHAIRDLADAGGNHHGGHRDSVCRTTVRKSVQANLRSSGHLGLCAGGVGVARHHFDDVVGGQRGAAFSALHEFAERAAHLPARIFRKTSFTMRTCSMR